MVKEGGEVAVYRTYCQRLVGIAAMAILVLSASTIAHAGGSATVEGKYSFRETIPGVFIEQGTGLVYEPGFIAIADVVSLRWPVGPTHQMHSRGVAVGLRVVDCISGDCVERVEMWSSARLEQTGGELRYVEPTGGEQDLPSVGQRLLVALAPSARKADPNYDQEKAKLWWPRGEYWALPSTTRSASMEDAVLSERVGFEVRYGVEIETLRLSRDPGTSTTRQTRRNAGAALERMQSEFDERTRRHQALQEWRGIAQQGER